MAVVLGTNAGFVTTAPTANPADTNFAIDYKAVVTKDTSPATATKITEIGWYCDNATEEANFEVGLYAADGAVVPGEAGTLLYSVTTNAKGTNAGWKVVSGLNWTISPNTVYWLGVQLDDTATITYGNYALSGGPGIDILSNQTSLPSPFGGGALADSDGMGAIYAVWTAGVEGQQYSIACSDSVSLTGILINRSFFSKNFTDVLKISAEEITAFFLNLSDTLGFTDTILKTQNLFKKFTDDLSLTAIISKTQGLKKTLTENLVINEILSKLKRFTISLSETLGLTDTLSELRTAYILAVETIKLNEIFSKLTSFKKVLFQQISFKDIIYIPGTWWKKLKKNVSSWKYPAKHSASWVGGVKHIAYWEEEF